MLRRCYRSAVAPLSRVTAPVTRANGRSNSLAPRPPVRFSSFLEALGFGKSPDPPKAEELFKDVRSLYTQTLSPLNAKFFGPLEKASEDISPLPIVFVLGNHSSGKSSFINYVVGRKTQETGVAPTDDGFTCIVGGNRDLDQNGPAVVGDPTMGFGGLRQHGSNLINHLQLKVRENLKLSGVMIVDSPGMIDAPVTAASAAGSAASAQSAAAAADASRTRDRGYDFASVVKWFAERADVILLFQDPAKPGTTGETLNIMTTALSGMDYKLSIVLNKCDQFSTVHDFARGECSTASCCRCSASRTCRRTTEVYRLPAATAELHHRLCRCSHSSHPSTSSCSVRRAVLEPEQGHPAQGSTPHLHHARARGEPRPRGQRGGGVGVAAGRGARPRCRAAGRESAPSMPSSKLLRWCRLLLLLLHSFPCLLLLLPALLHSSLPADRV